MAELVELIYTEEKRGTGKDGDPVRLVKQWWTKDGQLVVEKDEWLEYEISKKFPLRTKLLWKVDLQAEERDRLWRELQTTQGKIIAYENDLARYAELAGPLENMPTSLMHTLRAAAKKYITNKTHYSGDIRELTSRTLDALTSIKEWRRSGMILRDSIWAWETALDVIILSILIADNFKRNSLPSREES